MESEDTEALGGASLRQIKEIGEFLHVLWRVWDGFTRRATDLLSTYI